MADDNRVLKAWAELAPEQQNAMLERWGSEKAWYLCKYTNTIATGLREEMDESELARHYKIPLAAVRLAGQVAKGSVLPADNISNPAPDPQPTAIPPGAVQGPIIPPSPPASKQPASKASLAREKKKKTENDAADGLSEEDKKVFDSLAEEVKEASAPREKKSAKKKRGRKKVQKDQAQEPKKEEKKAPSGSPPFHPNAKVADWVKKGRGNSAPVRSSGSPLHPKAQVNPNPGSNSGPVPPTYEKSESYDVFRDRERR